MFTKYKEKNKIDNSYFKLENSTETFQNIIFAYEKAKKKKKLMRKSFDQFLAEEKTKIEKILGDKDYFLGEIKSSEEYKNKLIENKMDPTKLKNFKNKYKKKVKKEAFYTPTFNNIIYQKELIKNQKNISKKSVKIKLVNFPSININNKNYTSRNNNSFKLFINEKEKNHKNSKSIKSKFYFISKLNDLIDPENNDMAKKIVVLKNKNLFLEENQKEIKSYSFLNNFHNTSKNDDLSAIKSRGTKNYTTINKFNTKFSTNYINSIINTENDLINKKTKYNIYFKSQDYGCKLSKIKFSYLSNECHK